MTERLKQIPVKALEFWNKYTSKQKTIIISVVAVIFFAIVLLSYFLSRPQFKELATFEDQKDTGTLVELLDSEGIVHKESTDGTVVYVEKKSFTDAILIMSENDIPATGMTWDEALNNDMSTTESEKNQKYTLAAQSTLRQNLLAIEGVKDAVVYINQPTDDYTILSEQEDPSVSVMLTLSDSKEMTSTEAEALANWLANSVGASDTKNVRIIDDKSNLLFGGDSDSVLGGNINNKEEYKQKLTNTIKKNVEEVLIKYGYSDVEIGASNIQFNMDKITEMSTEYTPAEGQEQGLYSTSYNYKTEGGSDSGGIPGTDSNADETDYLTTDGTTTNSSTTLDKYEYLPNEQVKNIEYEIGAVEPENSTMAIVTTTYKIYNETEMQDQGLLTGTTFDQFVAANNTRTKLTVDPEVLTLVSLTTGIAENKLQVVAWEQPIFQPKEATQTNFSNYLMIVLAVLIVALLIFVVFKGTAPVEVTELEPELSVEQLLATTKENQMLEDIEFSEKSETRKMIEKFVDENPEAVAQLLRNWLNDDWG